MWQRSCARSVIVILRKKKKEHEQRLRGETMSWFLFAFVPSPRCFLLRPVAYSVLMMMLVDG